MKNILINIPHLRMSHGGIYQYSIALLNILSKSNNDFKFYILCFEPEDKLTELVENTNHFEFVKTKKPKYSTPVLHSYRFFNRFFKVLKINKSLIKKDLYDCIISEYNVDIIHSPTQTIVLKDNVKNITTMHDVQELHFPEYFSSEERAKRAVNYKKAIDGSGAVIVSYNHIKKDIIKYFNKPENQVFTILLDMQELWFDKIKTSDKSLLNKFDLPQKYLLYPASTWEHKNHLRLLKAIKQLNNEEIQLVCTGHQTEFYINQIKPLLIDYNLEHKVKFLGIVEDNELYLLYQNCKAVVVPTLYEAGSFPLMESIIMGIPVICSNVTSLPETMGNERFVFDPYDISDIANKIEMIWFEEEYRRDNLVLLDKQKVKLINNNASSKLNNLYENL